MGPGDRQSTDHIHDPRVPAVITYMRPVEEFVQDARYALRGMRRTPGFTAVAALTLALGIGANTAIFIVLYGVWLSPAKYAHSERLVDLTMQQLSGRRLMGGTSYSNLADWKAQASTVEAFGIHRYTFEVNVTGGVGAEEVFGHRVSANLFGLLGARPAVGRPMEAGADRSTGPRQALIAYTWWMRRFGGDAGIVGRQIQVDDEAFTIAGVMPPGFEFPAMGSAAFRPVIWMSLNLPVEQERARDSHSLRVVARLKPGASIRQAQAEMDTIAARLANAYPHENGGWGVKVTRLTDVRQLEDVRPALLLVMAAASLLLLIACANIANLLVARAAGREREMAIRRALGVTWRRLARQLLTESGMLALGGGAAGVLLAYGTLPLLKSVLPANMPRAEEISLNGAVLGFAAGVSLLTGLLFGLIPAVRPGGGSRNRATRLLVAAEVALALVLLAGAGLLMESFQRVSNVDLGFRKEHMLTARMDLSKRSYPDGQRVRAFREELLRRVHALPGVQYAGTVSSLPMGTISQGNGIRGRRKAGDGTGEAVCVLREHQHGLSAGDGHSAGGRPIFRSERWPGGATGNDHQRIAGARLVAGNCGSGPTHTVRRDMDQGNRNPHGAGRDAGLGVGNGGAGDTASGGRRSGHRAGWNAGNLAASGQVSVWRGTHGASDRGRRGDGVGSDSGGVGPVPGAPGDARGSGGSAAGGVALPGGPDWR